MKLDPAWVEDFSGGVALHVPPTKLPSTFSPRAYNTAMSAAEGGNLLIGPRPGYAHVASVGSGSSPIVAVANYHYEKAGTSVTYLIGVDAAGNIWELKTPTSVKISLPVHATYGFAGTEVAGATSGIQFVQANNALFGWVRGGIPFKIYRTSTDATLHAAQVGLKAPPAPTLNGATIAGLCNGTFQFRCTFYNVNSGVESSASATDLEVNLDDLGVTDKTIRLNLPNVYPEEATHIRVYVRKVGLQTEFTRDASMEVVVGTSILDVSFDDTALNNQILLSPDRYENNPPPAKIVCAWWHLARMWASDGDLLYYSQVGNGDQWDPQFYEDPGRGDGQRLTALRTFSGDEGAIVILKERSVWLLAGDSPQTWELRQISPTLGAISTLSVVEGDNLMAWWSENGPVLWEYRDGGEPKALWSTVVEPLARANLIQLNRRDICVGVFDPLGHRFLWTLDPVSASYAWKVLPWNTVHRCFEAIGWDLTPGCLEALPSSAGETRIFMGVGQHLYQLSDRFRTDGATEGGVLHTTVAGGNAAALQLASAGPFGVNTRLSTARVIDLVSLRVHASAYTLVGTTLTWTTASPFVPVVGSRVVFDAPITEFDTAAIRPGTYDRRHRLLQLYAEIWANADARALVSVFRDHEQTPRRVWQVTIDRGDLLAGGTPTELSGAVQRFKRWMGLLCLWHRVRLTLWDPGARVRLERIGWTTDVQGDEE